MLLNVSRVEKSFVTQDGLLPVLRGVDLQLEAGQKLALTGESGSGKSTLLHLIGGLDNFDSGAIEIDGIDIALMSDFERAGLRRCKIGVVFQQYNLIPSLSVWDNLRFHARLAGREDRNWIDTLVHRLGLRDKLNQYPEQLSGGQQQRVAVGRTLAARPKLVLADEPTGNLDENTSDDVVDLMLELAEESGAGLLLVTHSLRLAKRMDQNLHLQAGRVA